MNYLFFLIPFLAYCAEMPTEQGAYPQQFSRDTLTNTDTYAFNVFRWDSIINSGNDTLYLFGPPSQMPDCAIGKVCIECTNIAGTQNLKMTVQKQSYPDTLFWYQVMPERDVKSNYDCVSSTVFGGRYRVVIDGTGTQITKYMVSVKVNQ